MRKKRQVTRLEDSAQDLTRRMYSASRLRSRRRGLENVTLRLRSVRRPCHCRRNSMTAASWIKRVLRSLRRCAPRNEWNRRGVWFLGKLRLATEPDQQNVPTMRQNCRVSSCGRSGNRGRPLCRHGGPRLGRIESRCPAVCRSRGLGNRARGSQRRRRCCPCGPA